MWSVPARHSDACITQTSKLVISHTVPVKDTGGSRDTHTGHTRDTQAHKGT